MKTISILIAALMIGFTSCSTATKSSVETDRSKLSPLISKEEMIDQISAALDGVEGITDSQREELRDIHAQVMTESWEINQGIREHKILLFKYLTASSVDNKKVKYAKKQITRLYGKKLNLMLSSLDKVKEIMGKDAGKVFDSPAFMHMHKSETIRTH